MKNIGSEIKRLRLERKMSADKLAEMIGKTGVSRKQFIYDMESGRVKTSLRLKKKIRTGLTNGLEISTISLCLKEKVWPKCLQEPPVPMKKSSVHPIKTQKTIL